MDESRLIIHVDMNSFFARVEQQDNRALRGRPVAVGGRPGTRSIVAAASVEAKVRGVKTAMSTAEALAVCPSLLLVRGRPPRYREVSEAVMRLVIRHTPDVEVFSIDECFADLTAAVKYAAEPLMAAVAIAVAIKRDIRREIGDYLTCSIGVAPNKFLAKLASDCLKPDGLHVVTATGRERLTLPALAPPPLFKISARDSLLLTSNLTDFCGLGPRLARHLGRLGIKSVAQLRRADPSLLMRIFGVVGLDLWQRSWGIDNRPVAAHYQQPVEQSLSHAKTLPATLWRPAEADRFLVGLVAKLARRLRQKGLATRRVSAWFRTDSALRGRGGHLLLAQPTRDDLVIYRAARQIWRRYPSFTPVRQIGVGVSLLVPAAELTAPLLPDDQRAERLLLALDSVADRFGDGCLLRASGWSVRHRQSEATHAFGHRFNE